MDWLELNMKIRKKNCVKRSNGLKWTDTTTERWASNENILYRIVWFSFHLQRFFSCVLSLFLHTQMHGIHMSGKLYAVTKRVVMRTSSTLWYDLVFRSNFICIYIWFKWVPVLWMLEILGSSGTTSNKLGQVFDSNTGTQRVRIQRWTTTTTKITMRSAEAIAFQKLIRRKWDLWCVHLLYILVHCRPFKTIHL